MKLSHAGLMIFANPLLLGKSEGVTGVGSSALLGVMDCGFVSSFASWLVWFLPVMLAIWLASREEPPEK